MSYETYVNGCLKFLINNQSKKKSNHITSFLIFTMNTLILAGIALLLLIQGIFLLLQLNAIERRLLQILEWLSAISHKLDDNFSDKKKDRGGESM
jgi:hypothetical protein